ncbi:MAG TPA: hypothetical protein VLO11_09755, partial [Luteolibacter sp.]|nr:hypothetical protein [Luteolibacter sp.]
AEKVVPVMNDDEVRALILDHYRGESQTLTTGTEANFLKFKELIGDRTEKEQARWNEIKTTFRRNTTARGTGGEDDPVGRVVGQLSAFQDGLEGIRGALTQQLGKPAAAPPQLNIDLAPVAAAISSLEHAFSKQSAEPALAASLGQGIDALRADLTRALTAVHSGTMADSLKSIMHELEMVHSTLATVKDMAARQRDHLQASRELLGERAKQGAVEVEVTQDLLENQAAFLEKFQSAIAEAQRQREAARSPTKPAVPDSNQNPPAP